MTKSYFLDCIKKFFIFLAVIISVEFVFGSIAEYLFKKQTTGKYARITQALEKTSADIIVLGSSHANRHYVPKVLEDNLNLTCYNAGVLGQKLIFQKVMSDIILSRTTPKLLVLNIDDDWLFETEDAYEKLADLYPYYLEYEKQLSPYVTKKYDFEFVKFYSRLYRYNSTIAHIVKYAVKPQIDYNGYVPLTGVLDPKSPNINYDKVLNDNERKIDTNFVNALRGIISNAKQKNIKLVFVKSPSIYEPKSLNRSAILIKKIADENNVYWIDFSRTKDFKYKYELFNDDNHLNDQGANIFSKYLSDSVKQKKII